MNSIWRIPGGRAGVATALAAGLLAAAILLGSGHGPGKAAAAAPAADLSLTKSDSPDPVTTGGTLTYTIKIHNAGPDPATNTVVTDGLPGAVTYVSATATGGGTCSRSGSKIVCDLGTVTTTVDRTITIKTTVKKKSGEFTNSASVTSDVTDENPGNNLDSELTKISNPEPVKCDGQTATIVGTAGPDVIFGTVGDDVVFADAGDDLVFGFAGGDFICGGPGTDVLRGGRGSDAILGGLGSDFIRGRRGDDGLHGGRGRDRLRGGNGDDLVDGGRGFDRCRGGAGLDALRGCEG
jgi:uncharacterized repeat protein (TIGR01451 family)